MAKADLDTSHVPETLTAPWFKRFFKERFGVPVRVQSGTYTDVWIRSEDAGRKLAYSHQFPPELGNLCMRTVYKGSENLSSQNWGGNVRSNSIAIRDHQWREVLQQIIDGVLDVPVQSKLGD